MNLRRAPLLEVAATYTELVCDDDCLTDPNFGATSDTNCIIFYHPNSP